MLKLKQMKIWLCWNYIEVKGKKTKKPVAAGGGATGTNSEYQKTWVTYDEAILAKQHMKADDIGFVILSIILDTILKKLKAEPE